MIEDEFLALTPQEQQRRLLHVLTLQQHDGDQWTLYVQATGEVLLRGGGDIGEADRRAITTASQAYHGRLDAQR